MTGMKVHWPINCSWLGIESGIYSGAGERFTSKPRVPSHHLNTDILQGIERQNKPQKKCEIRNKKQHSDDLVAGEIWSWRYSVAACELGIKISRHRTNDTYIRVQKIVFDFISSATCIATHYYHVASLNLHVGPWNACNMSYCPFK